MRCLVEKALALLREPPAELAFWLSEMMLQTDGLLGQMSWSCTPSLRLLTSDRGQKVADLLQIVSHLPRLCPGSYSQAQEEQKNEKSVLMNWDRISNFPVILQSAICAGVDARWSPEGCLPSMCVQFEAYSLLPGHMVRHITHLLLCFCLLSLSLAGCGLPWFLIWKWWSGPR